MRLIPIIAIISYKFLVSAILNRFLVNLFHRYHLKYANLDHISVYDNDGSVGEYLEQLPPDSKISYFPNWGATNAMSREANASRDHYACTETYVENQCIWNARGIAEWAFLMHNIDVWLADRRGGRDFRGELDAAPLNVRHFARCYAKNTFYSPQRHADLSTLYRTVHNGFSLPQASIISPLSYDF